MNRWSFVWTPEFLVGTLVVGLLLNVLGAYVVRTLDRVRTRLTGYLRGVLGKEAARTDQLAAAAASDNAVWAALAAEASRLRLHQLLRFSIAFAFIGAFLLLYGRGELIPSASNLFVRSAVVGFVAFGLIQYVKGLEFGTRARRLDIALAAAHRSRKLPVMD
jgi:hypothetical protein